MNQRQVASRTSTFTIAVVIAILVAISGLAILMEGGSTSQYSGDMAISSDLSDDEQAYVTYVLPRLVSLSDSVNQVTSLVQGHSRNVLALTQHGNRIEAIIGDLDAWRAEHAVPERFATIDAQIVDGSTIAQTCIQAARDALTSFDFSAIPDLIPQFEEGASTLGTALTSLQAENGSVIAP